MKKQLTLLFGILCFALAANAQYYYFPHINAGQNPGGLNIDDEYPVGGGQPAGWTSIHPGGATTPQWSSTVTIPFTFSFNGAAVTSYKVSTSGVLTFTTGATTPPPVANVALPSALIPDNSVCCWGISGSGTNDNICTKTFGTAPNRQHWISFTSYTDPGNNAYTYYSIVIEESTNKIYVVDQRNGGTALTLTIGIQINASSAISVTGSPNIAQNAGTDPSPADNSYYEFIYGTQPANDAELSSINYTQYVTTPTNVTVSGVITNLGASTINTIDLKYDLNGTTYTDTKTGLSIAPLGTYNFTHATAINANAIGTYSFKFWVDLAGDVNHINDSLNGIINYLPFLPTKHVVFEEATGTWCGWCPRGAVFMDSLRNLHGQEVMLIAVHNADPMTVTAYDSWMGTKISGYPSGLVDRKDLDIDPSDFISEYNSLITDIPPCDVNVSATYNSSTNVGTFTVSPQFAASLNGDYRINCVVTEDNLTGTTSTWGQTNYYSYQTANLPLQGAGHNWQNETDPIPAANMEYDHVARAILGGPDGVQGSLPANITSGSTHSWTFNYNIPTTYNVSNLIIIGWVSDYATGRILNANSATVTTGIHNLSGTNFNMTVTPNPITSDYGQVRVNLKKNTDVVFEIIDVLGNIVRTNYQSQMSAGEYIYPVNFSGLSNGIYSVRMNASGETLTQKVVLNK